MTFQPDVDLRLEIEGIGYTFTQHPAAPGIPYGQEGRAAVVYQLLADQGQKRALKVFKATFREPSLVLLSERVRPFAALPGLSVCERTVLRPQQHNDLLRRYPDLTYAVLMPWIEGPTWMEILLSKKVLTDEQSLVIAHSLAKVLTEMEQHEIAHCDLSSANVMLPILARGEDAALVDVEGLYAPNLAHPKHLLTGTKGYVHLSTIGQDSKTSITTNGGAWSARSDRFAGAVLLAEILGWSNGNVRETTFGESYFAPEETQQDSTRYRLLSNTLHEIWGTDVARCFERAWQSSTLNDCPTFGEWQIALPEEVPLMRPVVEQPLQTKHEVEPTQNPDHNTTVQALLEVAQKLKERGDFAAALKIYHQTTTLLPTQSPLSEELHSSLAEIEAKLDTSQPAENESKAHNEQLFIEALSAYRNKKWAEAEELLSQIERCDPDFEQNGDKVSELLQGVRAHLTKQSSPAIRKLVAAIAGGCVLLLISGWLYSRYQEQKVVMAHATATAQAAATSTALWEAAIAQEISTTATAQAQAKATAAAQAAATATRQAKATATAQARATAAAAREATATAQAKATVTAAFIATATANAQATARARATATALANATPTLTPSEWNLNIELWARGPESPPPISPQTYCIKGLTGKQHSILLGACSPPGSVTKGYMCIPVKFDNQCESFCQTMGPTAYNFGDGARVVIHPRSEGPGGAVGWTHQSNGDAVLHMTLNFVGLPCE